MKKPCLTIILAVLVAVAGHVVAQDETSEWSMVLEGRIDETRLIGLVPEGIRTDAFLSGEFTEGPFAGATGTWTNYLLIRRDGVRVMDVRGYAEDPDGMPVIWTMKGFLGEPSPPPLEARIEAMLDPDFQYPDVDLMLHGAAWFQTMTPEHGFVNHTVFSFSGTVNAFQGTSRVTFRPLADPER
jgi:hypothetical protein